MEILKKLTGAGNIDARILGNSDFNYEISSVRVHLSAAATAAAPALVISMMASNVTASPYNVKFFSQPTKGVQDILWTPAPSEPIMAQDGIRVTWTNDAGGDAKTWGLIMLGKRRI